MSWSMGAAATSSLDWEDIGGIWKQCTQPGNAIYIWYKMPYWDVVLSMTGGVSACTLLPPVSLMVFRSPETALRSVLKNLPPRPIDKDDLDKLVKKTLKDTPSKFAPEIRKGQWEFALKNEVLTHAMKEGKALDDPETTYYDEIMDRLDLVLTFTEQDATEQTFPFTALQDLLETQTIPSCSHIFSWIEARTDRLTEGMVPQKGKALILLRMLNDLLRRLSKMGSNTIFCGRILTFLSGVFPLGERSGVNLRGEYGPIWEGVQPRAKDEEKSSKEESTEKEKQEQDAMQVDEKRADGEKPAPGAKSIDKKQDKKDDFYETFWSLQLPFSRPPLFANPSTLAEFKESVNKIADTHFRRQFLFQLLILLNHLLTFTKSAKASWSSPRNRSLQIDFTLEPDDAKWVTETIAKAQEELRQTAPGGRAFADTVHAIIEREKNWVRWKNDLCTPFDREPYAEEVEGRKVGLEEATRESRKKMRIEPEEWEHRLGSAALTEIWDMGYRDLRDLQNPFQPGEVKDFVAKIKLEDNRINMRQKALERAAERAAQAKAKAATPVSHPAPTPTPQGKDVAPAAPPDVAPFPTPAPTPAPEKPTDSQILKLEENKHRWSWLALRAARDRYLAHFGKIGSGDITLLAHEIEKEARAERERIEQGVKEGAGALVGSATGAGEERGGESQCSWRGCGACGQGGG
ncbi:hypothetical protein EWM64_g5550 [Hericium alpestre]|uniref:THO complex subunit 1 transcription elongation factor n=1 Tax=Hericium alpestre TaxID=135208 RepID=A0A4Y9ZUI6_9AGAM|nr:hypothetical protein EWM64_g5550 [Hericium alpestre]